MSFRSEEKIILSENKIFLFEKWIFQNGGKQLFPERIINSVYFDNFNFTMYRQSIEGLTPRRKIRLRVYKNNFINKQDIDSINLEQKITSTEGRFKVSKKLKFFPTELFTKGIFSNDYGYCKPILNVKYLRKYYILDKFRVTIDREITYRKIINKNFSTFFIKDNENVGEVKSPIIVENNFLKSEFPFVRSRFSKYCRGIEKLNIF